MKNISIVVALVVFCSSAYADDGADRRQNKLYASAGFKIIGSTLTRFTNNTHPIYVTLGYSHHLFNNLSLDMNCSIGGAGNFNSHTNTNTDETRMLTYVEPSLGAIYKFTDNNKRLFPFLEFGGTYVTAKLKNDVDNKIDSNGSAFGVFSGIGINIMLDDFEILVGAKYSYTSISFTPVVKDNIGGPGVYVKAGYTF